MLEAQKKGSVYRTSFRLTQPLTISQAQSHSESNVGDWTMDKDGWVVDDQSRLLVWVPGDIRKGLKWPGTQVRVGPSGDVRLKFDKSRMGESWAQSYTSEM